MTTKVNLKPDVPFVNGKYCVFTAWQVAHLKFNDETMQYLIYQRECCPDTKRLHWQGYVEFKANTRRKAAQLQLGIIDADTIDSDGKLLAGYWRAFNRRGTGSEAAAYCEKRDSAVNEYVYEWGSMEKKQPGQRTDLEKPAEALRKGASLRDLAREFTPAMIKYSRGFERVYQLLKPEIKAPDPCIELRFWQRELIKRIDKGFKKRQILWVWSEASATGKSTMYDYMCFKYGMDKVLPGAWTKTDLLHAYSQHTVVSFNVPRNQPMTKAMIDVLESISDGGVQMSIKYDSCAKLINAVVIVFANIPPPNVDMPDRCIDICVDSDEVQQDRILKGLPVPSKTLASVKAEERVLKFQQFMESERELMDSDIVKLDEYS
nr:putative replication associated protein [Crucivirus sp.]